MNRKILLKTFKRLFLGIIELKHDNFNIYFGFIT